MKNNGYIVLGPVKADIMCNSKEGEIPHLNFAVQTFFAWQ